jgi:hypothetical protein
MKVIACSIVLPGLQICCKTSTDTSSAAANM